MNIEVINTNKSIDYTKSKKILENRVHDVYSGKKDELLWILELDGEITWPFFRFLEECMNHLIDIAS